MSDHVNCDAGQSLVNDGVAGHTSLQAAVPGTYLSPDETNPTHRGVKVIVDITAITGGTLTVTIQGKDPVSGKYYTLLASSALAGTGTTILTVYPGIAVTANQSANDVLPATWNVKAVQASGGNVTATIGSCELI